MKKKSKIIISISILCILFVACGCYTYKSSFGIWEIKKSSKAEIVWADFIWKNQTINGKYFEKTAMLIPCKIKEIENNLTFQFDIGSNRTMLYEKSLSSFYFQNETLSENVEKFKFPLNFSKNKKLFKNLNISFGGYELFNESSYVLGNYGLVSSVEKINKGDTIHIGTIGADLFQGKVLIIDYPKQKFAICEEVPDQFKKTLVDIELDKNGRPVLPLLLNSKKYRILFDNGSSLFPLATSTKNINNFSTNPVLDSIEISSWGEKHIVDSRMITDTFDLAGRKFCNVKIYENHTGLGIDKKTDGMAGNFLFWNSTIVIDFKNKKIGIY
ncbi:hypothetical protein MWU58_12485 [Flavobacteriaceae bacterium S0825]|uniref:hypothetical protein n=1 Tax=Gaetbulibacter sp. S0825 TaxID=2720084 RepID=UPI001431B9C0|nr:hypothetical protein [Gaetbulibacter sp. S0825]MCK0110116.1 hypothetical protein [Flavobacteriaceae bacterium S0825]NIX65745.1 hypothetical protein [Gaetbulibacter sp. S0825]